MTNHIKQDPDSITILLFAGNAVDIVNANPVKRLKKIAFDSTLDMKVPVGTWKLAYEDHAKVHAAIRSLELRVGRPIGILQDLQGPKIRVGTIKDGKIAVAAGSTTIADYIVDSGIRTAVPQD